MNKRLNILHLEDEPDFAELVRSLLLQDGLDMEIKRVADRLAFNQAMDGGTYDLIISDYHLPSFTGLEALAIARKKRPHTPFILVSGTIGEHAAIESLKAGATDYVLKQHPDRLPSAVRRAVAEAAEHAKLRGAENELIRREKYFRALTENALDVLSIVSREGIFTYKSPSVKRVLGYEPQELIGENVFTHVHPEDLARAQEIFWSVLAEPGKTVMLQLRYQHKDGSWRQLEAICQNRLDDPEIAGVVVNSRDATDRWRAEEELRGSEKQYRLLFQDNPNPMWVFDLETLHFLEVNESAIQHYGYSREEFLAMTIMDIRVPEKDGPAKNNPVGVQDSSLIWRHRRKDGGLIDLQVTWTPMAFRGHFAALTMAVDVTERRRVEHRNAAFSKLSHRLSSATTAPEAALVICEAADELFKWDDFALDMYSESDDQVFSLLNITTVEGRRVEIPSSRQPKSVNALIERVVKKGAELLSPELAKEYSASIMLAPVRKRSRVIGVLFIQNRVVGLYTKQDLDTLQTLADQCGGALERLRAEEELKHSQRRFSELFDNSPDAIFVEDLQSNVLDVNRSACALHGLAREKLIGKNAIEELVPPARREAAHKDFEKLASGEISWIEGESLGVDGQVVPVEIRVVRVQYDRRPALLFHVRNITERREAESKRLKSEALFHSVWENSVDGMRLTDENGVIVYVNEAFCKLVGMKREELGGKPLAVIYATTQDHEKIISSHCEHFRAGRIREKAEYQLLLHDNRPVVFEVTDSYIGDVGKPQLLLSLFRDVTSQRLLEEQLRQSQKMEAIGQLAGGVAHDFNNILTVIHGHASLLGMADVTDSTARSAQQIKMAAERAADLTRKLLAFSRRQLIQPKRLDMNKIVSNYTDMLGRLLGEDIALQLNYYPAPAMVEADANHMEQVLLNFAVNARDAMPKGGRLSVQIEVLAVNEDHVKFHPEARAGEFVCSSISDTGCGIPAENLQRIFEPFFTTKAVGKGTGLGLATVYGIVKQHQGWIEVESQIGQGTTFRVYLPYAGPQEAEAEKPTTQITVRGGTETILLAEDEAAVRELVARILQNYGYVVHQASDGNQAVEIWNQHKDKINLLLTDLIMPGNMNGRELAEKIWSERPDLKVIFSSGYSADIVGKDFKLEPEVNFLQKPYDPRTLALTVRRCLDGKHG